jgi:DNA-binding GntR family transcriptional regulator
MAQTDEMMSAKPKQRERGESSKSVVDYVAEAIRAGVLDGRYAPGQRLVEADITQEFGISRGPLREALRRLAADGVVEIQAHRGATVKRPSRAELRDMFRVREVLEGLAARMAAEHIKEQGLRQKTATALAGLRESGPLFDVMDYIEDNERFHRTIFELSGNGKLQQSMRQLQMPTYRFAFFRLFKSANRQRSSEQHGAILDAIQAGDPDRAEAEMRTHVRDTEELSRGMPDVFFRSKPSYL